MLNWRSRLIRFSAIQLTMAGLLAVLLPADPAQAFFLFRRGSRNDYQVCANSLLSAGITAQVAADACAAALEPRDLSQCVVSINQSTTITAADALSTCRRVRRPEQLATCVVNIEVATAATATPTVLDYCRRSLLPLQFSDCVVGVQSETAIPVATALESCVAVSRPTFTPRPNFVPATAQPPVRFTPLVPPQPRVDE